MRVKKKLNGFLNKYGKSLCAMATIITSYGVLSCRWTFYQPKEPDGLSGFTKSIRWEEHIMENGPPISEGFLPFQSNGQVEW